VLIDDATALIDQIDRRPVAVAECIPRSVAVVLGDGVDNTELFYGLFNIAEEFFVWLLGRVHTDHNQSLILEAFMP
jgi:hypothetical protein